MSSNSKRKARDPAAPKRNQSAYLLYQNAMRETFRLQNPGMTFGQLSKFTSAMYAEMPPQEKEQWNANAEADRVRYLAELAEYVPPPGYDTKGDAIEFAQVLQAKKGSAARDANAPKKNMSAYLIYQNTMREAFRAENPGMTFGQLSKFTSLMYASLTPLEKSRWELAAAEDKARYEAQISGYVPPPGFTPNGTMTESYRKMREAAGVGYGKHKKKQKDPNAPKRARGPYVFFTLDERPRILLETPDIKFTDLGHVMGQRWRALSAEEKKKYEELANVDKKRFQDEFAEYNATKPKSDNTAVDGLTRSPSHLNPLEQAQQHLYYQQQAAAMYATHPQYQEAQQYAEQYYTHPHGHVDAAAMATQYDPNAAAYAQYYAQGYIAQPYQTDQQTEFHF